LAGCRLTKAILRIRAIANKVGFEAERQKRTERGLVGEKGWEVELKL
jgi:hypothetical protein